MYSKYMLNMISQKNLQDFKDLYRKKFGQELTDQEAIESANKLVRLVEIVCKPLPKNTKYDPSKTKN